MRLSLLLLASLHFGLAVAAPSKEAAGSGVRARSWWTRVPASRPEQLAPDQSPNADLTIPGLDFRGEEEFLGTLSGGVVLHLDANLEIRREGPVRFHMRPPGPATLLVNGERIARAGDGERFADGRVVLPQGEAKLSIRLCLNRNARNFRLRWDPSGGDSLRPIHPDRLTCPEFNFRPTQPGIKSLRQGVDRPGRGMKVAGLHPALTIATLHSPDLPVPVGGLAMLADGRLAVAEFDARRLKAPRPQPEPDGKLWIYHLPDGKPGEIHRRLIADDLFEPSGLCAVGGVLYLGQRAEVTRFEEKPDGNWVSTPVARGWETNDFHALSFGLVHRPGPDGHPGFLYLGRGTGLGMRRNPPHHGAVWEIDLSKPAGRSRRSISGGHRTPNGLAIGPEGALFVTDNQGEWTPCNELNHVIEGGFYGFHHRLGKSSAPTPYQPESPGAGRVTEAAVWLPQDEIGNSPTQPIMIPEGWPFAGQMLIPDMKYGGLNRVHLQKVRGVWQGAAFRFTQGLEAGINRVEFGPDGSLYVGGIGGDHASTWNWVHPEGHPTYGGLQRLRPSGRTVLDLEAVTAVPGGFEITFTRPVARDWLARPGSIKARQWTYRASPRYGGPKVDDERLEVASTEPGPDGRSLRIMVGGLKKDRVVRLTVDAPGEDGSSIWSAEAWVTLRELPR